MEKMKNNKGITIIALVVTIVVILILAGITVSTLTGSNGILLQTQKEKDEIAEKSNYVENKISKYEEELSKSSPDIDLKKESGTNYIKIYDVTVINYTGNVDNYEYYIKKNEESKDMYKKVTTDDMKEMLENGLIHDTFYDIKIIAKNGDEQVLSRYTTIKTKELVCVNLIMRTENNQDYTQDVWTNKNITTSLEQRKDETTSSYASIEGSAQTINSTNSDSLVSMSGITQIRVQTTDGINTVSKDYKLKIDRMAPTLTIKSKGIADQYPETLTLQVKENEVQIDYIELPNGTRIRGEGKSIFTTTYNVTKNGPITCKVADTFGNESEQTIQVENVINFETEWTIAEANTEIYIPITGNVDVYIDYGDGNKEDVTSNNPTHIYANAGMYTIKISGKCNEWGISYIQEKDEKYNDYYEKVVKNLTGVKKWGCLENSYYGFFDCSNIVSTIPEPHQQSLKNITTFNSTFYNCQGLYGSIPLDLFSNSTKVKNLYRTFHNCKGLDGNIPEGIFDNCTLVTSIAGTFYGCENLTGGIPKDIFKNCKEVTNFASVFEGCKNLTGEIPSNLFDNNTKVTDLSRVFSGCSNLTGTIPEDLFINCTNVVDFQGTFNACSNLIGNIPQYIFHNCTEVTSFYGTFNECSKLTGNISENLFSNCTRVRSFTITFYGCENLTGSIPEKLFANCPNIIYALGTFRRCKNLTGEIPKELLANCKELTEVRMLFMDCGNLTGNISGNLFKNATKITSFAGVFSGCSKLTGEIPEELFANNTNASSFEGCFMGCENLTGNIPENTFKDLKNVTNFKRCFFNCGNLTGTIPERLFEDCINVTDFSNLFFGCENLTGNIPENLFKNCQQVTNFSKTFSFCRGLTGSIPEKLFANCPNAINFNGTFSGCSNLIGKIPEKLFENCKNAQIFGTEKRTTSVQEGTFRNCSSLTGMAPELWNNENVTASYSCFNGCVNLSNYNEIPDNWK